MTRISGAGVKEAGKVIALFVLIAGGLGGLWGAQRAEDDLFWQGVFLALAVVASIIMIGVAAVAALVYRQDGYL